MSRCIDTSTQCLNQCAKVCQLLALRHIPRSYSPISAPTLWKVTSRQYQISWGFTWQMAAAHSRYVQSSGTEQCTAPLHQGASLVGKKELHVARAREAMHSPLTNAYAKDTQCSDTRESIPIPMAVIIACNGRRQSVTHRPRAWCDCFWAKHRSAPTQA